MKKPFTNTIIAGLLLAGGFAAGTTLEDTTPVVSEIHTITKVTDQAIHGENITGSGEGIYYTHEHLEGYTDLEFEVGDKVEIQWTEESLRNEDWFEIYSIQEVGGGK